MNILNWFFCKITPIGKNTWLSIRYNRFLDERRNEKNANFLKNELKNFVFFDVAGAGTIAIGHQTNLETGGAKGPYFSVSWYKNGLCAGGVLDIVEAQRMATFLLAQCENHLKTQAKTECVHPYATLHKRGDIETCLACGKVLCEG